jgi:uncharacterized protein
MELSPMAFSLVPKNTKFDNLLIGLGDIAHQTAVALQRMLADYPGSGTISEIKTLEHQGDRIVREMVSELLGTFVTPYDREDIYELCKAADDVIDHIDEAASMFDIYQVEAVTGCVKGQADILVAATKELAEAMRSIGSEPTRMEQHWSTIHKLEDAGDELLRSGIKEVFAACYDEPAIIICWKDIYTQLEEAIDACERAATVLEGIGVKNA